MAQPCWTMLSVLKRVPFRRHVTAYFVLGCEVHTTGIRVHGPPEEYTRNHIYKCVTRIIQNAEIQQESWVSEGHLKREQVSKDGVARGISSFQDTKRNLGISQVFGRCV